MPDDFTAETKQALDLLGMALLQQLERPGDGDWSAVDFRASRGPAPPELLGAADEASEGFKIELDRHCLGRGAAPYTSPTGDRGMPRIGSRLHAGRKKSFEGPAVIDQLDTTTLVPPGVKAEVDEYLNIRMEVKLTWPPDAPSIPSPSRCSRTRS